MQCLIRTVRETFWGACCTTANIHNGTQLVKQSNIPNYMLTVIGSFTMPSHMRSHTDNVWILRNSTKNQFSGTSWVLKEFILRCDYHYDASC